MHPYQKLIKLSKQIAHLSSITYLLEWDQEIYMPAEGIAYRPEQIALLSGLVHQKKTSKAFAKSLNSLIDLDTKEIKDPHLTLLQIIALKRWRRDYLLAAKIPSSFVKKFATVTSNAAHVWQMAKKHNDFKLFLPHLQKVISLCRKKADIIGYQEHPYDALLDTYEPDAKTSDLINIFNQLKPPLKQLLKEISIKSPVENHFLYQLCPKHIQLEFAHLILEKMGFSLSSSRLDYSVHPFCTGLQPKDTRMTVAVNPENILGTISATLHEGGHGLYHIGLIAEHYGTPLAESLSLGIDESQSRFWETLIGQNRHFWQYFFPILQQNLPKQFGLITLDQFYRAINSIKPHFIRIEADEISYNLHILLRFEIEKQLIEGSLSVKDIPEAWNTRMRDYLGLDPKIDSQGCLQDIHWSLGMIGYFPTYALGNLYAAQFFSQFKKDQPNWGTQAEQGNLSPIRTWLQTHIHKFGRQYTQEELCQKITGSILSEKPFIDYLQKKYSTLYQLDS
ncbi:Thermostable carboxypeptidase 1 [Candidatus Rhabdochlamydia oedothoracis]|uniref:Metal-dependent carboxypeptidase n=1 Tax=Candidatus Rhabdochlamydia oedothoracis TaxID=2720720 RepID=A0ABX8UZX9_9BACT|nr:MULTISPECIES: carboxypeptidase M32 [Rhabdochlamydia]KAG6559601.1 Thermostable carboxypeptidase 1 [Candidatus Rhabdochlamydia sp. W815]QYF48509.1 Thermostable carboxypeptidase 1 [Candidatus Rhabdochlamydia oedothoracis]